jgi:hypothetical protein
VTTSSAVVLYGIAAAPMLSNRDFVDCLSQGVRAKVRARREAGVWRCSETF